tara:strand:+ start:105 stop:638 length:534 start_codon:yes stop_codon:yes gene_type:complete
MTLLESFLKSKRVKKTLNTKPGEEGFSLVELVVVIAVLAILSAVAIPAFVGVQANARAAAVKNGLVNGIKECVVRKADNKSTLFADAQSFANPNAYQGYIVSVVTTSIPDPNGGPDLTSDSTSCYTAIATPTDDDAGDSTFQIAMDPSTGVVVKTCTDDTAPGCDFNDDEVVDPGTW